MEIEEINRVEKLIVAATSTVKNIESHVKIKEKNASKTLKKELLLGGLCCPNCATKIEKESNRIDGVISAM